MSDVRKPTHGHTRHGHAVHGKTIDHLPEDSGYARFNKKVAIWLTKNAGSMTAFWIFWVMCLFILPSCLELMGVIHTTAFVATFGFNLLATWFLSTCLELTLMPAIMVGQNLQSAAADVRAAKTFEDTEIIADRLDLHTAGGIKEILDAINVLNMKVESLTTGVEKIMEGTTSSRSPGYTPSIHQQAQPKHGKEK